MVKNPIQWEYTSVVVSCIATVTEYSAEQYLKEWDCLIATEKTIMVA